MNVQVWLTVIILGGLLGMIGQAARVLVGLKKVGDEAAARNTTMREEFDPSRLVVSLLIGFVAGAAATIFLDPGNFVADSGNELKDVQTKVLLGLVAAGYAGTDFIEGFVRKLPSPGGASVRSSNPNDDR